MEGWVLVSILVPVEYALGGLLSEVALLCMKNRTDPDPVDSRNSARYINNYCPLKRMK